MAIEIFDIDLTIFGIGVKRFHGHEIESQTYDNGITILPVPIVFNDNPYLPAPIAVEGFEVSSKGLPTPQLTIGNAIGTIGGLIRLHDGLRGGKVRRTLLNQLPVTHSFSDADVIGLPDEYIIDRPTNHTRISVTFDLKSIFETGNSEFSQRIIFRSCSWIYKSAQCGYVGSLPSCSRSVEGCVEHFGAGQPLNFGGFAGVNQTV